jgi:hypothetical protein
MPKNADRLSRVSFETCAGCGDGFDDGGKAWFEDHKGSLSARSLSDLGAENPVIARWHLGCFVPCRLR